MATPRGLSDEEVDALAAPAKGMTDDEVEAQLAPVQGPLPADVGSPLDRALKEQKGDVVTVQTPTGPAQFTRSGARFFSPEESQQMFDAGGARFGERALATVANTLGRGGLLGPQQAGVAAVTRPWLDGPNGSRPNEGVLEHYRRVRDSTNRDLTAASRTSNVRPEIMGHKVDVLPAVASALPSLLSGNPAGVGGRLLLSTVLGLENAASSSDADLTKGEVIPFLADTAKGGALGLATGGVAEGVTAPMRLIARGAASRIGDSVATQAAKDAQAVADDIASTRGKLGAESQKASRMYENTLRGAGGGVALAGDSPISPATQGKALLALTDPSTVRLQEKVLNRTLGEMPGQTAVVERLEQELAQKTANASADAAKRTQDYFAKPAAAELLPKFGRALGSVATGTAGGGALGLGYGLIKGGDFSDLPAFLKTGAVAGIAGGSGLKTMLKNARTSPRVQASALESLIQATQMGEKAMQAEARGVSTAQPRLKDNEEDAVQAFLASP